MLEGVGRSATTPVEVESNAEGVGRSATTPVEVESNAEKAWAGLLQRQSKSNQMLNSVIQNDAGSSGSKDQMITRSGQVEVDCI
jgi:hypothetical protein